MRAQISLEFLFNFLIILAVISSMSLILINFYEKAKNQEEVIDKTISAEEIARTIDVLASIGNYKAIRIGSYNYKIENNLVIIEHNGKTIVANTIFNKREGDAQHI